MKKILLSILILLFSISINSQNLFVTKRDYSNPVNYIHTLQKININDGLVIENNNYTSSFPGSYSPRSLVYNHYTNEVIAMVSTVFCENKASSSASVLASIASKLKPRSSNKEIYFFTVFLESDK